MFKIALCDDQQAVCNSLENTIIKYMQIKTKSYSIDTFNSADEMLYHINKGNSYDTIFLDIEMEGITGIEFGEIMRNDMDDEQTKIIFISWQSSYAMDLFKVRPIDFIIKPLTKSKVFGILDIALKLIDDENEFFVYKSGGKYTKIRSVEILYFRSLNRKIIIHSVDGEIDFYGNMEELVQKINEEYFWRIHKSYIINYMQVKKIEYTDAVMNNGEILPISQRYRVDIRNRQRSMLVQERKDD